MQEAYIMIMRNTKTYARPRLKIVLLSTLGDYSLPVEIASAPASFQERECLKD